MEFHSSRALRCLALIRTDALVRVLTNKPRCLHNMKYRWTEAQCSYQHTASAVISDSSSDLRAHTGNIKSSYKWSTLDYTKRSTRTWVSVLQARP